MILCRRHWTIVGVLMALAIATAAWWMLRPDTMKRLPTESEVRSRESDSRLPILVYLDPGTIVETTLPLGWSHSVIKTITHLAGGDVDTLPTFAKVSATKFRTVVLADVRPDPRTGRFILSRVGAGLGTTHNGRDTIISYDSLAKLGVDFSTLDGMVLNRAEKALGRSRIAARTATFALYDTYVELAKKSGKHHSIMLRYAIVVDPEKGTLRCVVWNVEADPVARSAPNILSLLPENFLFKCGVHVEARRMIGNLVTSWGFAMADLPAGKAIPMSPTLDKMATLEPAEIDAASLESAVRETLD